ncbi:MAG: GYF domain-containing protein [Isosphaeraceae bacterium]|nr:GYF domain-containing protein [Isosphaeraceae bacterium]
MTSEEWYVRDRNRVTGPFDRDQLDAMRRRGQLARFHQVSQDRQRWVSATTLTGLFASTAPSAAIELEPSEHAPAPGSLPAWFYSMGKDPAGPVSLEDLLNLFRAGAISAETLVWREGLPTWVAVRDSGLFVSSPSLAAAPQPLAARSTGHGKNKVSAALFAFFLGGLGMHKFYLGAWGWGIIYLLTFWTFIPAIIALIEFIMFLAISDRAFDEKYNSGNVTAFTW